MKTKLLVGLGNPGKQFENTRHNIGFALLDNLLQHFRHSIDYEIKENESKKFYGKLVLVTSANSSTKLILLYPQTFMNLSGKSVKATLDWFKIKNLKQLLIIHDDVSLPLGKIRWTSNGGAGGQHGVESIIEHLAGQKGFNRLKFGIGPDPGGDRRSKYVLEKFTSKDEDLLNRSSTLALKSLIQFTDDKPVTEIMNEFNGLTA
ncbi:MAG: aminoacyl-tRNA hydrolase [Candidatus Caenarcaniphilales bacterium]|nr:aminoacyl-tRNA hydrolase [Candidatus Caenarcaniphilales bacterium]